MDNVIHLSCWLNCDPQRAFEMFTVNAQLESWLVTVADVEPRTGGLYELFWDPADRENNSTIGCRITAMQDGQFLSFEWRSPKQFKHFANQADPLTHAVVMFIPNRNGTRVHLIHSGWRSSEEWLEAMRWQERAWQMALDKLEEMLK